MPVLSRKLTASTTARWPGLAEVIVMLPSLRNDRMTSAG